MSPTTVSMQAPQRAHHSLTLALVTPCCRPSLRGSPQSSCSSSLFLRTTPCAVCTAWRDSLVSNFLAAARLRPKVSRLGRDDKWIAPSVPRGKINSLASFHPASSNNRLSCSCCSLVSAIFADIRVLTAVANLNDVYRMRRSVGAGAWGSVGAHERPNTKGIRAQPVQRQLGHVRQDPPRQPGARRKLRCTLSASDIRYPKAPPRGPRASALRI